MGSEVSKSDWKHFNVVRAVALERLCTRILDNVCKTAADKTITAHERFLSVQNFVNESNEDIARGFDFLSRSRMLLHLAAMQSLDIMEQAEIEGFSENVRENLARFARLA